MNSNIIRECIDGSHNGTMTFPQVIGKLMNEGIEAYHVDLVRWENRYYTATGESCVMDTPHQQRQAAQAFSSEGVIAAVRNIQAGNINYLQFLEQILAAGTVYYIAYIAGKRVIYLGRHGDLHIEYFPQAK